MRIRSYLPECLFIAIIAGILAYILLVEPIVGIADSGDFPRLMDWFGLLSVDHNRPGTVYLFVSRYYEWHRHLEVHYPSSEVLFIGMALLANLAVSKNGLFDIRVLGATHALCLLLVMLLLTKYTRTLPLRHRLFLYPLLALMFADIGYIAYFSSFLSEQAIFIFLGSTVAFTLAAIADREPGGRRLFYIVGFFVSSMLFVTTKLPNFILSVPLAVLGCRLGLMAVPGVKQQAKRIRRLAIGLTVMLLVFSAAYFMVYNRLTDSMKTNNVCNAIFFELLAHSPDPDADAYELGLDSSVVMYRGVYAASDIIPDSVREAAGQVGTIGVVKFYLHHADRFLDLMSRAAEAAFCQRPTHLGNYERFYVLRDGSEPVTPSMVLPEEYLSEKFAYWSSFKDRAVPKTLGFLVTFILINVLAVGVKWIRVDRTPGRRMITELHTALLVMAVMQFLTVILGEGTADITKHLFLFNLLCEVCFVFLLAYAVSLVEWALLRRIPVRMSREHEPDRHEKESAVSHRPQPFTFLR